MVFVVLYQDPITSDPCEAESFTPVNQPQTRLAGVAEPSEISSRLIADVQLDNGFPLMLGVATPKVAVYARS